MSVSTSHQAGSFSHVPSASLLPSSSIKDCNGMVPDDKFPNVMPGEIRELGNTMHPFVATHLFSPLREKWLLADCWTVKKQIVIKQKTAAELHSLGVDKDKAIQAVAEYLSLPTSTKPGKKGSPSYKSHEEALKKNLPVDIPVSSSVKEGRVADDDPRVGLRGKKSLVATQKIKKNTIIGIYRGYVQMVREHNRLLAHPPSSWISLGDELSWEMLVEAYCWCDMKDYSIDQKKTHYLYCSGVGYGNPCSLVNDPSILEPFFLPPNEASPLDDEVEYEDCDKVASSNCVMFPCVIRGWPYIFLMTTRDVDPEKELLYSYGPEYWDHVVKLSESQERAAARTKSNTSLINISNDDTFGDDGDIDKSHSDQNKEVTFEFQETHEKPQPEAHNKPRPAPPPHKRKRVVAHDRDPWDDDEDDKDEDLDDDERDLCLYLLPSETIRPEEDDKEEGELDSPTPDQEERRRGIHSEIKSVLQMRRHMLQLERLVVTFMGERERREKLRWNKMKQPGEYQPNHQAYSVSPSLLQRTIKGFSSHSISPSHFLESRPMLFAPLPTPSAQGRHYVLKGGHLAAAREVVRGQEKAFHHCLEQLKVNLVNYMHDKRRPRVYLSEVTPGVGDIFDSYSRAWWNLFQPYKQIHRHHHQGPPGSSSNSGSVEGNSSSNSLKRPNDEGSAADGISNDGTFINLFLVSSTDFKLNRYDQGIEVLELEMNLANRLRGARKTFYDPSLCDLYRRNGRCLGGVKCQQVHLVPQRQRKGADGRREVEIRSGSSLDQGDSYSVMR